MIQIQDGQCGLCAHFGEHVPDQPQLIQIRLKGEAPESLVEPCGLPENEAIGLKVSVVSGCQGFTPAEKVQA